MSNVREETRAPLSADAFATIPSKVTKGIEFLVDAYCDKLLHTNANLLRLFEHHREGYEDPALWRMLTNGQKVLISLTSLDGQVNNGGIAQFFWNYPNLVFDARDGLAELGAGRLLELYDECLEKLIGRKEDWLELRRKCYRIPDKPDWESFAESYNIVDGNRFDKAYYGRWNENDGLGRALLQQIVDYIKANRSEYVVD